MKVLSNSQGLVDFAIWAGKFCSKPAQLASEGFREFKLQNCNQFCSSKIFTPFHNCTGAKWVLNIAQLVEHCSANAEAMGSNPVEVPKFFFTLICNCLNYSYHCDDHMYVWTS